MAIGKVTRSSLGFARGRQGHRARSPEGLGRIGVLMGGPSSEREVSLKSGHAVYKSLKEAGIDVAVIDIKSENKEANIRLINDNRIKCAFLALHGRFGEDGSIQEILEEMNLPYTGSGVEASRLAMDKIASRKIFQSNGLNVPRYTEIDKKTYAVNGNFNNSNFPLVVKPATHGSSIGLSIVDKKENLIKAIDIAFSFDHRIIIEEYIHGREVTIGVLDGKALPVVEIVPKNKFFDYEAKYSVGMTEYIVPAQLEQSVAQLAQRVGVAAHRLLKCYGCSRVDMILNDANIPFILEVNTIPGLTQTSLLPKAAAVLGIDFTKLCIKLIQLAYEKK